MRKLFTLLSLCISFFAHSQSSTLVISQVYTGGGSASAIYNQDYVELHNISSIPQSLAGLSIQYATVTGAFTGVFVLPTTASVPPGGYFLVQMNTSTACASCTTPIVADATSPTNISLPTGAAKVALVNGTTAITSCPAANVIDLFAYYTATLPNCSETAGFTGLTATVAAFRKDNGCQDTDNNSLDFEAAAPAPRNAATTAVSCGGVISNPLLKSNRASLYFGSVNVGSSSDTLRVGINGSNLTGAPDSITFSSSSLEFELSKDNINWASTIRLPYTSGSFAANIFTRFSPQSIGFKTGEISITGGGVTSPLLIPVSGNAVSATAPSNDSLVISQIYSGGGDAGALYNADYVEIFNRSASSIINLENFSIQYVDGGAPLKVNWSGKVKLPNFALAPGKYYLVQMSATGASGQALPSPDLIAAPSLNLNAARGRLVLMSDTANVINCPNTNNVYDKVAYGSDICFDGTLIDESLYNSNLNTVALYRFNGGCVDTDNNGLDFEVLAPSPRNSQSPDNFCGPTTPSLSASVVPDFGNLLLGQISSAAYFDLTGNYLQNFPGVITIKVPSFDFQITQDTTNVNSWANQIGIVYSGSVLNKRVYVRFNPQTYGLKLDSLQIFGGGYADTLRVKVRGNCVPLEPSLIADPLSPFGNLCINTSTAPGQYQFQLFGSNLNPQEIVVPSINGFQFATDQNGPYQDSIVFPPSAVVGGNFFSNIYVIFNPTSVISYNGTIYIYGGGDTTPFPQAFIAAGINSSPIVSAGIAAPVSQTTAVIAGSIPDSGCTALVSYGVEYSTVQGFATGSGIVANSNNLLGSNFTVNLTRLTGSTTYYYRTFAENSGAGRSYSNVELSFTTSVNPIPTLQSSRPLLNFGNVFIPIPSASQSFEIQGYELNGAPGNINVKAPIDFEVSLDNVNFTDTSVNVQYFSDTLAPTIIYVRFVPRNPGSADKKVIISGGGLSSSLNISVKGVGVLSGTSSIRISQIYGGGNSSGSAYNADYVELHNNNPTLPQSLFGMSIQYGSDLSTGWSTTINLPNAVLPPGGYYLIQISDTGAIGSSLPLPDFIASPKVNMNISDGKLALVINQLTLSNCPSIAQAVDMVGYGSTLCAETIPTNDPLDGNKAAFRKNAGCDDSNNNFIDFISSAPAPRNSGDPAFVCVPPVPFINTIRSIINYGNVCLTDSSKIDSVSLSGANLTADPIQVGPATGFTFSWSAAGPYVDSLLINATNGLLERKLYIKFRPVDTLNVFISVSINGGGLPNPKFVALRGKGATIVPLVINTAAASGITANSATAAGTVVSSGCTPISSYYGIVYSTSSGFTTGTIVLSTNLNANSFSSGLNGLTFSTTYFYRAFAANGTDTVYGAELQFTTQGPPKPVLKPSLLNNFGTICVGDTSSFNSFTLICDQLNASVINVGPAAGYVFAETSAGPYTSSLALNAGGVADTFTVYVKFTPVTAGSINVNVQIRTVGGDTTVRASGTAFNAPPEVTTGGVTVESFINARTFATLDDIGCSPVIERGVEYSKVDGFPSGTGIKVKADSIIGDDFVTYLRNLAPNTTYYFKAYARNSNGTGYGEQLSFTTGDIQGGLSLYPVPARPGSTITLRHYPIESGNYTIKIFNIMGQMVYKKDNVNVVGPVFNYPVGLSNLLKTGRYTLQLESFKFLRRATFYVQ
jgi:hypothetical protein